MTFSIVTWLIGGLMAGVLLFLWSGLTQQLPWGVPSAQVVISADSVESDTFQGENIERHDAHSLTTPLFDETMVNRVNTLTTDETFSWIVTKPRAYYNPLAYLGREALTQMLTGLLLAAALIIARPLGLSGQLLVVLLLALAATVATYGQLFNWWGLTTRYAIGASLNLIVGWLVAAFMVAYFVMR
jgi:hypothetical protein